MAESHTVEADDSDAEDMQHWERVTLESTPVTVSTPSTHGRRLFSVGSSRSIRSSSSRSSSRSSSNSSLPGLSAAALDAAPALDDLLTGLTW